MQSCPIIASYHPLSPFFPATPARTQKQLKHESRGDTKVLVKDNVTRSPFSFIGGGDSQAKGERAVKALSHGQKSPVPRVAQIKHVGAVLVQILYIGDSLPNFDIENEEALKAQEGGPSCWEKINSTNRLQDRGDNISRLSVVRAPQTTQGPASKKTPNKGRRPRLWISHRRKFKFHGVWALVGRPYKLSKREKVKSRRCEFQWRRTDPSLPVGVSRARKSRGHLGR